MAKRFTTGSKEGTLSLRVPSTKRETSLYGGALKVKNL